MRMTLAAPRRGANHADRIVLSERDTARVLKLLKKPPKPTLALVAAARRRITRKNLGS